MSEEPAETIDCIGLYCPQPLFLTRESINEIEVGQILEVLADDPAAEEDIKRFVKRTGHELVMYERLEDGVHRFLIRRTK